MNLAIPTTNDYKHRNEVGAHTSVESKEWCMHNVRGAT
jgi:hypothetical protein